MNNEEIIKQIKGCFLDLKADKDNKEILTAIRDKTKSLIYKNEELAISKEISDLFEDNEMSIGIFNNTENIPDQYIIYVALRNEIGVSILEVGKEDLIKE